ncbi:MAG: conserved phage C-terminal domain-containing protein [Bacillota bacterium]|nr:conserved phage C-terminal domain-containing protein [Bacillota bacterium]
MSGQDNVVTIPKMYIELTGDLTAALVLNQIVFWSDKTKRNDGFFYKSYKEWQEETTLSERQVRYAVKKLKEKNIVETKLKKANGAPTLHYKLEYDKLLDLILTLCQNPNLQDVRMETDNMSESLTENTTENTTDEKDNNVTVVPINKIPYNEIVDYLNVKAGTHYKTTGNKTRDLIKKRWSEGFTLNDFKTVIDIKVADAFNPKEYFQSKYLRPETLFGTKFESYLNQKEVNHFGSVKSGSEQSHSSEYDGLSI